MDLLQTQPYCDYDDVDTQKIEEEPNEKQNEQVGELIVNSKPYPIYKGINNIGRNTHCDIHLEDQSISKYHAEIEAHKYPVSSWISDLNSCNKTILNNIVLRPTRYYELKDNSTIQFGKIKAIYKSCNSEKELIIPETPEHVSQNNVTVSNSKTTPNLLLNTDSTMNKNNCTITSIQEYSKKSISCTSTNQSARKILQNISKKNVSIQINVTSCEQNDCSTSYESDDIFDAATQHVDIESYMENMQNNLSLEKETKKQDKNVSSIDNTTTMEQKCNGISSTSTPINKTNSKDQVDKLNSIERDIASTIKRLQTSKNDSSCSVNENNKEKENNVDISDIETQPLPDCNPNSEKKQTDKDTKGIDNMEMLSTQVIDFSGLACRVNRSDERYKEKNDTDIYAIDTQIINIESNDRSDAIMELHANRIDITKCNSSIEDIDYETASTQLIGEREIKIINGKTFKLAKSNFQTDVQNEDDDILSRLPEVTISGTLSNSSTPVALVKRTSKSRKSYGNKKTANKSDKSNKNNDNDSTTQKNNSRSSHSMDKRSSEVDVKSSTDKQPKVNTKSKTNKTNTKTKIDKRPKRNTRSMTNKESEEKNDASEEEMGEESQEVAMIMKNSLISDNSRSKNIGRKRKILNVNLDDNSLNNSNNGSRNGETSNKKLKVHVKLTRQSKSSKNNTLRSSVDYTTDNSLVNKDKEKKSLPSTRNSSLTRSMTNMKKEIDQNNSIILRKRKKKEYDLSMDVEMIIRTSDTHKNNLSNVNSNSSFSTPKEKILFTGVTDEEYVQILKLLGGVKVDDPSECTVLVTDKIRRTTKFLCCLAKAMPIVSVNWLLESKRAGYFLDRNNYLIKDPVMEAKYGFRLRKSLEKAKERQLLEGYMVLLTPNIVSPPIAELKAMILSCGGKPSLRAPSNFPTQTVIISDEQDCNKTKKWLVRAPKNITVQSTEFILTGILKQELNFVKYRLMV